MATGPAFALEIGAILSIGRGGSEGADVSGRVGCLGAAGTPSAAITDIPRRPMVPTRAERTT
jgi:hypothetical protein